MRRKAVGYALGKLLQVIGALLLIPLAIGAYDYRHLSVTQISNQPEIVGFMVAIIFSLIIGTFLVLFSRSARDQQGIKEGYAIVTLGWIGMAFVCSIPIFTYLIADMGFELTGIVTAFTDSYFEVMSGLTTTGATVFSDVESLPRSLLFVRALTHWLGGMGIITLAIVIFPAMGVSGYQMFRGEVPGPTKDRFQPGLTQTASVLWGVYLLFSLAQTILLLIGGMDLFEAVCHTFATMATGGFSTSNSSIAGFNSDFIEWVVIIFMYFAGINFLLHFRAIHGDFRGMLRNREFVFYNAVILATIVVTTAVLYWNGPSSVEVAAEHYRHDPMTTEAFAAHHAAQVDLTEGFNDALRTSAFQTLAIVTTTGFCTADFDLWPDFLRFLLVFLMFFGGCAGSTGGGMKMIRVMVVFKVAINELRRLVQPRLVKPVKVGEGIIDEGRIVNIVSFFILFVGLFVVVALLMTLFVPDLMTAITCSIATIGNIGPGLAGIGAVENYGWIPIPGKWILIFSMLLGRLEIFTVLIVLRPAVWRK